MTSKRERIVNDIDLVPCDTIQVGDDGVEDSIFGIELQGNNLDLSKYSKSEYLCPEKSINMTMLG